MSENESISIYIGIPAYQDSARLLETLEWLKRNTLMPYLIDVQIEKQSVVLNKNAILTRARQSGAQYIAFCDDDVEPEYGWDQKLVNGLRTATERRKRPFGQTSPLILFPDLKVQFSWVNVFFDVLDGRHSISPQNWGLPNEKAPKVLLECGALPGTCTLFTSEFLETINWEFDDRYPQSQYEDIDQSLTCRAAGFQLLHNGTVSAIHYQKFVHPRSEHDNLDRLIEKWSDRSDLTLIVPVDQKIIERKRLDGERTDRSEKAISRLFVQKFISRCSISDIITIARMFRKCGVRGAKNHLYRMLEQDGW